MKKIFILSLLSLLFFSACADLDVPPKKYRYRSRSFDERIGSGNLYGENV